MRGAEESAKLLGVTKADLYERMEINASTWSRLITGKFNPRMTTYLAITRELDRLDAEVANLGEPSG